MTSSERPTAFTWSRPNAPPLDLNGPTVPFRRFEDDWVERPAIDLFREAAQEFAGRIACQDQAQSLTFSETWSASQRLAALLDAAVAPGRPVGVLLPNEASYPVAVLACLAAARPCVMIDRHHPEDRIAAIVRDAGLAAVVVRQSDLGGGLLLPAGLPTFAIDAALDMARKHGSSTATFTARSMPADAPSFIVYTSGSTGQPKGVVLSQRAVLHRACELINSVHLRADDKVLSLASPSTIGGLQQIFEVMLSGATLVKLDLQRVGLGTVIEAVAERRITMMFSTPAVWRSVSGLEGARQALATLRCIQSSGDALLKVDLDLVRRVLSPHCLVLSVYGATEAPALLQWFVPSSVPADETRIPAGYPLAGFDLAVVDEEGTSVPPGEAGELIIRSPWTSLGTWRKGTVHADPFEPAEEGSTATIYRTGDIVRQRPDGLFVTLGRQDRQIKIRGNRIELAELETALLRMPRIHNAAVIARRADREPRILAFVEPRDGNEPGLVNELRAELARLLPAYMQPSRLFALDHLPLLPGRKIDESALLALAARDEPTLQDNGRAPERPRASQRSVDLVGRAWRLTFGAEPPNGDRTFGDLGGDSLRLLQMVFHLERLSGLSLPLEKFEVGFNAVGFALALDCIADGAPAESRTERPAVFVFPPFALGHPPLASFCASCADQLRIRQIKYPDVGSIAHRGAEFDDIVAPALDQIGEIAPTGPIVLTGYSDGGDAAYCAAEKLLAAGREIALLCLFDSDTPELGHARADRSQEAPPTPTKRRLIDLPGRLARGWRRRDWQRLVMALLPRAVVTRPVLKPLVNLLLRARTLMPARWVFMIDRHLTEVLFHDLHERWVRSAPHPLLAVPAVLFRSDEQRPGAPGDLGWRARLPQLAIVAITGDHSTMLLEPNAGLLRRHFIESIRRSSSVDSRCSQ